jgi:hypothetical protein
MPIANSIAQISRICERKFSIAGFVKRFVKKCAVEIDSFVKAAYHIDFRKIRCRGGDALN